MDDLIEEEIVDRDGFAAAVRNRKKERRAYLFPLGVRLRGFEVRFVKRELEKGRARET